MNPEPNGAPWFLLILLSLLVATVVWALLTRWFILPQCQCARCATDQGAARARAEADWAQGLQRLGACEARRGQIQQAWDLDTQTLAEQLRGLQTQSVGSAQLQSQTCTQKLTECSTTGAATSKTCSDERAAAKTACDNAVAQLRNQAATCNLELQAALTQQSETCTSDQQRCVADAAADLQRCEDAGTAALAECNAAQSTATSALETCNTNLLSRTNPTTPTGTLLRRWDASDTTTLVLEGDRVTEWTAIATNLAAGSTVTPKWTIHSANAGDSTRWPQYDPIRCAVNFSEAGNSLYGPAANVGASWGCSLYLMVTLMQVGGATASATGDVLANQYGVLNGNHLANGFRLTAVTPCTIKCDYSDSTSNLGTIPVRFRGMLNTGTQLSAVGINRHVIGLVLDAAAGGKVSLSVDGLLNPNSPSEVAHTGTSSTAAVDLFLGRQSSSVGQTARFLCHEIRIYDVVHAPAAMLQTAAHMHHYWNAL